MARKKKKAINKTTYEWLLPQLRDVYRTWPQKSVARDRAKVRVEIGRYKNGNPEYKIKFKCYICEELFEKQDTQIDHVDSVVDPQVGFVDWNTYIDRLFCDADNLRCACKPCHQLKTLWENDERKRHRKAKKDEDIY